MQNLLSFNVAWFSSAYGVRDLLEHICFGKEAHKVTATSY